MSSFSAPSAALQRSKLSEQLIDSLQKIEKIESSERHRNLLDDLRKLNEVLPCGERNPVDLMKNHESEVKKFAGEEFVVIIEEIIMKFGENSEEVPEEILKLAEITDDVQYPVELMNILCKKLIQKRPKFVAKLLQILVKNESYLVFVFIRLSWLPAIEKIDNFIQQIISLHDKIGNQLMSEFPDSFNPRSFSAVLMLNAIKTFHVISAVNKAEQLKVYDLKFLSKLISKVVVNFQGDKVVARSSLYLLAHLAAIEDYRENVKELLMGLSRSAIVIAADLIFDSFSEKQIVSMIGNSWKLCCDWKFSIMKKLPLLSFATNDKLAENLTTFLVREDAKAAEDLLNELLGIWGSKSHINDTSFDQHFYVTKLIVMFVKKLPKVDDVKQALFNGTQHHIGSADRKLRALGMITAEKVLEITEKDLQEKLKFDYSDFDETILIEIVQKIQEIVEKDENSHESGKDALKILEEIAENSKNLEKKSQSFILESKIPSKLPKLSNQLLDSDDEEDSCAPVDPDDDCPPLDESKRPRYLLDLIQNFTTKESLEDPEKFEYSMSGASEIIQQQLSKNHTDIAVDLLRIFIRLDKACYMENFEELKLKSLVEICSIYPKEAAQFLCQEFNSESTEYSLNRRLFLLDVLNETAKVLSKLETPKVNQTSEASMKKPQNNNKLLIKLNEELENRNKRDAQQIIRQRLMAKTRKVTTQTKVPDKNAGVNRFSSVASYFFFPLIHGFGRKQMIFKSGTNLSNDIDNLLLVKFLNTISVILLCAENSPMAPKMAKEIISLSVFLRYHEESKIRLAVLHMVATVLLTIPRNILVSQFSAEINELANHLGMIIKSGVVNYEADHECREFARQLMKMFSDAMDCAEI